MKIAYKLKSIKTLSVCTALGVVLLSSYTYAVDDQTIYNEAQTRINNIQNVSVSGLPNAPVNRDQKGSVANIISRLFDGTGKIRSIFIRAFDGLSVGNIPAWTGDSFTDSNISQSGSQINISGDVNITGDLYQSGSLFKGGLWEEGVGSIYYNSGSVGVGVNTPTSTLHVDGDIQVGNTTDICGTNRAGSMRFHSGSIQLCTDQDFNFAVSIPNCATGELLQNNSGVLECVDPTATIDFGEKFVITKTGTSNTQNVANGSYTVVQVFNEDLATEVFTYSSSTASFEVKTGKGGNYNLYFFFGGHAWYGGSNDSMVGAVAVNSSPLALGNHGSPSGIVVESNIKHPTGVTAQTGGGKALNVTLNDGDHVQFLGRRAGNGTVTYTPEIGEVYLLIVPN